MQVGIAPNPSIYIMLRDSEIANVELPVAPLCWTVYGLASMQ